MSDGASVYECTSADEVIDLVQGGQGVFGIAVGRVWREVEGSLSELPSERADGTPTETAGRRARRPSPYPRDRLSRHSPPALRTRSDAPARAARTSAARDVCCSCW